MRLRPQDLEIMYEQAAREYPNECCGVVIGKIGDPESNEVRPGTNIQHELREKYPHLYSRDADTGYFLDPRELKTIFEEAGKRGLDIVGFYHSHPNHDPYWSQEDYRAAMWADSEEPSFPDAFNVVVSVYDGVVKGASVFVWDAAAKKFLEEKIE